MSRIASPLDAIDASALLVDTSEAGGHAAQLVVVGGTDASLLGRRLARTRTDEDTLHGTLGSEALDARGARLLDEVLDDPRAREGLRTLRRPDGTELEVYVELRRAVQELIVVGAGHIAQPLARLGALLGFRVTVLDDRPAFATRERFPEAERVLSADFDDPFRDVAIHGRTHLLLVTRGHKYDYACLVRALRLDPAPAYIGMIGSRRRVRATFEQLLRDGIEREALGRIHAPVGLDVGAETPEEIAVAVAAELVLVRRGGSGRPLRDVERVAERFFQDAEPDAT